MEKALAQFLNQLCVNEVEINHNKLSSHYFLAYWLVPLNWNPGWRPIGVGVVLRRIAGKSISCVHH